MIYGKFEPDSNSGGRLGDVNYDGVVNLLDVGPFINAISNGELDPKADVNEEGADNLLTPHRSDSGS